MPNQIRDGISSLEKSVAPATPAAGKRLLYPKSDGWYQKDSAGVESLLAAGGSLPARLGTTVEVVTDWNNATSNGFYGSANTAANAPAAVFLVGIVESPAANYATQTVWDYVNSAEANGWGWRRMRVGGVWGSWYRTPLTSGDVITMAGMTPSYAGNRSKPFNPDTSLYNITDTSMQRWETIQIVLHGPCCRRGGLFVDIPHPRRAGEALWARIALDPVPLDLDDLDLVHLDRGDGHFFVVENGLELDDLNDCLRQHDWCPWS